MDGAACEAKPLLDVKPNPDVGAAEEAPKPLVLAVEPKPLVLEVEPNPPALEEEPNPPKPVEVAGSPKALVLPKPPVAGAAEAPPKPMIKGRRGTRLIFRIYHFQTLQKKELQRNQNQ